MIIDNRRRTRTQKRRDLNQLDSSTTDHIVARSLGGKDDESNWALSCRSCNSNKKDQSLAQAGMILSWIPSNSGKTVLLTGR